MASFQCTDPWGHRYIVSDAVSVPGALHCQPLDAAGPLPVAQSSPLTPQLAAVVLGLPVPAVRGALAVTVEYRGAAPALPVAPRLRLAGSVAAAGPGPELRALVDNVARTYEHDAHLLLAIIHVESRFNPDAVSPKGAIGLMQVMPSTARSLGVQEPQRSLFDPETNLHAGARHLRRLRDLFGDRLELALAAYNAGEGAVLRYQRQIPPFVETQAYVRQVMAAYRLKPDPP